MTSDEDGAALLPRRRRRTRLNRFVRRNLVAQAVLAYVPTALIVVFLWQVDSVLVKLLIAALLVGVGVSFLHTQRVKERARHGAHGDSGVDEDEDDEEEDDLGLMLQRREVPRAPEHRARMRALLKDRWRLVGRTRWAVPVLFAVMAGLIVLGFVTAGWQGGLACVGVAAFAIGVPYAVRRYQIGRLAWMEDALAETTPASPASTSAPAQPPASAPAQPPASGPAPLPEA